MARTIGLATVAFVMVGLGLFVVTRPPVPWPVESRRVVHPEGFSIVEPPDWEHFLTFDDGKQSDAVRIVPKKAVGNIGTIQITKVNVPVTPEGIAKKHYQRIAFQGQTAYTLTTESQFTRDHTRTFLFQRNGVWYDLLVRRPQVEPIETGVWMAYAESFRVEPAHASPTTVPATTSPTTNLATPP